jgi:hypothetical protein
VLALAAPTAASAAPAGFFGVVPQGPLSAADFQRMQGVVGTLRIPVSWSQCEPRPGEYDFTQLDGVVAAAAEHGIRVLPFISGTPAWLSPDQARPPLWSAAARAAWSGFLRALVERYGPGGSLWAEGSPQPRPIRDWQIWNEPNFRLFWHPHPSPRAYARLLELAASAIRGRDPGARIVLAGVAPVGGGWLPWVFLRHLYRVPGVKADFDVAAVHPYAVTVQSMSEQIELARSAMDAAGDRGTPLLVSELGVASTGAIPSAFVKGLGGQASFLQRAFGVLLAKRRAWHLAGVDWFSWQDVAAPDPHCGFCQGAGLLDLSGEPKPAWQVYESIVAAERARSVR